MGVGGAIVGFFLFRIQNEPNETCPFDLQTRNNMIGKLRVKSGGGEA